MLGALTAADGDLDLSMDEDVEETPTGYEVNVSEGVADLTPVYDMAIERLRGQRRGLSAKERLGALLVGFGQPTRSGKWQEGLANASQTLFQQSLMRRDQDEKRRSQLERLMNAREVAKIRSNASIKAAEIRAKGGVGGVGGKKLNADETKRLGYAKRAFPGKSDEELVPMLYEPVIDRLMISPQVAASAAGGGYDADQYLPPGSTVAEMRQEAQAAISKGAPKDQVLERLRRWGVPVEGL